MHYLATTRFNTQTWKENKQWREKNNWSGCIYGIPVQIADRYVPQTHIFVLEMHNDKNKIKGIGLIKNAIVIGKYHNIYSDGNYNRYTYKSNYRIDRKQLNNDEKAIIRTLDILVFKGYTHLKRGQGIKVVPAWITNNRHINFTQFFKELFHKYSNT